MKPYIICDPQENVLNYDLRFDGVNHWTAPVYEILEGPDAGKVMLKFDINLAGLSEGHHDVIIKAMNTYGESPPAPFSFDLDIPDTPLNIRIESLP